MALVAPDGRWLKVNRSVCELLGYSEPELLATNFQALTHPEDLDADLSYVRQLLRGEIRTYQMEKRYFHKLGQIVWALLSVSLVRDGEGNPIYFIAQIQNITDRKQAEDALRQINAQLERRGQERAEALLKSEQRYRSLVKATAQVVWLADPEGKALGTMADWREYTGQPTEQMQGWGWLEAIHPEDRERTRRNWTKAVETQSFYKAEYRLRTRDGSYRHHIAKAVPILEADGNIREWVGANTDITEQKQAERARRKSDKLYRTLARNFPNGSVLLFDRDLRYLIAEGVSLGEAGKEQLEGRTMWEALPEQTCGILEPLYRAALAGETRITEIPHSGLIYQVHTLPVKNEQGEIFAGMVMAQDITLYKQAEAVLQRARDLLEMRVRERTQELTEANAALQAEISDRQLAEQRLEKLADELKRSNQELEQFAYVASHDLQEPLRAVTGYTQLLELEYRDNLDETALDYMNFIVDGAGRMQQLIQDLLAYSRVGTHAGEFTPVDCNAVVKQVLQNLQVAIAHDRATVTCDPLPAVMANKTQLLQLFQNLISNAVKFRREEPPQVRIWAHSSDRAWLFQVRDNGIGIKRRYQERIFEIFKRLHTRREFPGTGIGLAICKKIVERHGGRIWVESQPGVGTTFYFTLPAPPSPLATPANDDELSIAQTD
jgi:PAS domain S-box-containing protein